MITYAIDNDFLCEINKIEIQRLNSVAMTQLIKTLRAVLSKDGASSQFILIDAHKAQMLPMRLLATELRVVAHQNGRINANIALVISNKIYSEAISDMITTILERDNVELFTSVDKAYLWLDLAMKRLSKD